MTPRLAALAIPFLVPLVVVGRDAADAAYVAQALAREAFHNVAYFPGSFDESRAALRGSRGGSGGSGRN
jgi:hypothetical protein